LCEKHVADLWTLKFHLPTLKFHLPISGCARSISPMLECTVCEKHFSSLWSLMTHLPTRLHGNKLYNAGWAARGAAGHQMPAMQYTETLTRTVACVAPPYWQEQAPHGRRRRR